jgi:hypothetical protein
MSAMGSRAAAARIQSRRNPGYILLAGSVLLVVSIFLPWLEIDTSVGTARSTTVIGGFGFHGLVLLPLAAAVAVTAYLFLKQRVGLALRVTLLVLTVAIGWVIAIGSTEMNARFSNASHAFGPGLLGHSGLKLGAYTSVVAALSIALGALLGLGYQPGLVEPSVQLWPRKHDMV